MLESSEARSWRYPETLLAMGAEQVRSTLSLHTLQLYSLESFSRELVLLARLILPCRSCALEKRAFAAPHLHAGPAVAPGLAAATRPLVRGCWRRRQLVPPCLP